MKASNGHGVSASFHPRSGFAIRASQLTIGLARMAKPGADESHNRRLFFGELCTAQRAQLQNSRCGLVLNVTPSGNTVFERRGNGRWHD